MIIDFLSTPPPAKTAPTDISSREGAEFTALLMAMADAQPKAGEAEVAARDESSVPPDPADAGPGISVSRDTGAPDHEGRESRANSGPAPGTRSPDAGAAIAPSRQGHIGGEAVAANAQVSAQSTTRPRPESPAPPPQTAVPSETERPAPRHPVNAAASGHGASQSAGGQLLGGRLPGSDASTAVLQEAGQRATLPATRPALNPVRGRVTADLPLIAQEGQGQDTRRSRAPIAPTLPASVTRAPSAGLPGTDPAAPHTTNVDFSALWASGDDASTAILQEGGQSATDPARDPVRGPMPAAHAAPEAAKTPPDRAGLNTVRSVGPPARTSGMPAPPRFATTEGPISGTQPSVALAMPEPAGSRAPVSSTPLAVDGTATAPTRPTIEPFAALQGAEEPGAGHAERGDGRTVLSSAETPLPGGPAAAAATQAEAAMRNTIDAARHAAQQIAARAVDLGHGRFELSLSPTEL
ncbi:MAG TPA: hypothetical protein GX700_14935, partial [Paracoccus sp.]|nr:hypothetical protein [Paracoccus sp. (in: a-proteobacteria)]